jgi:redox-sensitive bicupin YhaK (pirin superfamily)
VTIEVRRASDRFVTHDKGRTTWHSFSFGSHYDPRNVGFGAITALNDEQLPPGTGYPDHPHRDVEIVTLVLSGGLRHTDSEGRSGVLVPGEVARTSAGSGIVHAEVADGSETTRFLQTWLRPDTSGGPSSYAAAPVGPSSGLTEVVGPDGVIGIGTSGARLYVGHLDVGPVTLPDAPLLHVFVVDGALTVGDRGMGPGDAARLSDEGERALEMDAQGTIAVWSFESVTPGPSRARRSG